MVGQYNKISLKFIEVFYSNLNLLVRNLPYRLFEKLANAANANIFQIDLFFCYITELLAVYLT